MSDCASEKVGAPQKPGAREKTGAREISDVPEKSAAEVVRAATDPFPLGVPTGTHPIGAGPYLEPGQIVRWHFRRPDFAQHLTEVIQPVRVVAHDERGLVVWLHGGTQTAESRLAGWEDINPHEVPHEVRFVPEPPPRVQVPGSWYGTGVLRIVPADSPFSVWVFRDRTGRFRSWYINLEQQHRLLPADSATADPAAVGTPVAADLFTADHVLDIVVDPQGNTRFKDEDELAGAVRYGMWTPDVAERIRANSRLALDALHTTGAAAHWAFGAGWTGWREPAAWGALGSEFVQHWLA